MNFRWGVFPATVEIGSRRGNRGLAYRGGYRYASLHPTRQLPAEDPNADSAKRMPASPEQLRPVAHDMDVRRSVG